MIDVVVAWTDTQSQEDEDVRLTDDMKRLVHEQRLGFVATVTPDSRPNLSPKGTTTVLDDERLMFIDVASPGTVGNLVTNPFVEVNVVDPVVRKGYRFSGTARAVADGDEFEQALMTARRNGVTTARERIRSIVIVEVTDASPLVSPAYDSGATETDIARVWLQRITDRFRNLMV